MVATLSQHMRSKAHGWSIARAKNTKNIFNIRKQSSKRTLKPDLRKKQHCPVKGCFSVVTRLNKHVAKVHSLTSKTRASNSFYGASENDYSEENLTLVSNFENWLLTADGGCLNPVTAERQAQQLLRLSRYLSVNTAL